MFRHERGAFTGADRPVHGRFEQASGGTLFLGEISRMPPAFQQKILRVVEYGTFTRIGGMHELRTTARVLAASNADLVESIRQGAFLPDLYDRLAFEVVHVPPLRERQGDVRVLARHFLREFLKEVPALGDKGWDEPALAALERYSFPGNVRELKTIVERAACRDTTREINLDDLALREATASGEGPFRDRVEAFERQLIRHALTASGGNQADAARRLGLAYHRGCISHYWHRGGRAWVPIGGRPIRRIVRSGSSDASGRSEKSISRRTTAGRTSLRMVSTPRRWKFPQARPINRLILP